MLNQLLVLGQIPGTSFQVTFSDLAFLFDLTLIYYLLRRHGYSVDRLRARFYYYRLYFSVKHGRQLSLPLKAGLTARTN
jgi:hypothetical protein